MQKEKINTENLESLSKEELIKIIKNLENENNNAKVIHEIISKSKSRTRVYMVVNGISPIQSKTYSLLFRCSDEDYNRLNKIIPIINTIEKD